MGLRSGGRQLGEDPPDGEGPTPRFTRNAVYDATGHRMLIWSGRMVGGSGSTFLNDVWALDLATDQWTSMELPVARYGTAAIFDPLAGSLVTFAGVTTQGRFDDTWHFDPTDGAWRDVASGVYLAVLKTSSARRVTRLAPLR